MRGPSKTVGKAGRQGKLGSGLAGSLNPSLLVCVLHGRLQVRPVAYRVRHYGVAIKLIPGL